MLEEMLVEARRQELSAAGLMIGHLMEVDAMRQVERLEAQLVRARARAAMIPVTVSG